MLNEWRRKADSDTWHFCTNCTRWPTVSPVESVALEAGERPTSGELCNECVSKSKRKTCKPEIPLNVEGGRQSRKRKED